MSTFIARTDGGGDGPRLAVKDLIDVAGLPTTAGCRALADRAQPAERDAPLLAGARRAGARLVGKVNLHELALGATGVNPWFGTPVNPLAPDRVPGGSSSGSAVVVAIREADVAYGSDTAGSVRIPAACCGVAGLKTTHGRVPLEGVWPLAPSLDTVGPLARDVAGLVLGMQLLEPGFAVADSAPAVVGRLRPPADPRIDAAVDRALAAAGLEVLPIELPGWSASIDAGSVVLAAEAWESDRGVAGEAASPLGSDVADILAFGAAIPPERVVEAESAIAAWRRQVADALARVELLALPTLGVMPPRLDGDLSPGPLIRLTMPVNVAGLPAVALPVPCDGPLPASLQLVGPAGGEEALLAAAARVEAAVAG